MLTRIALFVSFIISVSPAFSQVATFDGGSLYDLDPKAEQSTSSRILEQMLDNDDMQPISELGPSDVIRKLANSVGRLTLEFKPDGASPRAKGAYCTASLIGDDLIITNHHCIPGIGNIARALLTMGYIKPRTRQGVAQYPVNLKPVETSEALDYSILRVEGNPGREWGTIPLSKTTPEVLATLFVIHHPGGFPQYVTRGRCQTNDPAVDGDDILHKCDTLPGSSGAPIFDNNTRKVVGFHYSAVALKRLNAGKRIASLAETSSIIAGLLSREKLATTEPDGGVRPPLSEAALVWEQIKENEDIPTFEAFRRQFGRENPLYDRLAEIRAAELRILKKTLNQTNVDRNPGTVVLFDNVLLKRDENKLYRDVDVALSLESIASRSAKVAVNQQSVGIAFGERKFFKRRDVTCELQLMETDLEGAWARLSIACKR